MENYIEFIEKEHIYLIDGIIVPSVTQLLKKLFPCKYENIPEKILEDKSIYGIELHKFIEIIEKKKPKRTKKVGRNDPCPCGSGKKYKQCCGK